LEEAVEGSDCIVVMTDHSEFREMDPRGFCGKMKKLNIFDSRNIIDGFIWEEKGYHIKPWKRVGKISINLKK